MTFGEQRFTELCQSGCGIVELDTLTQFAAETEGCECTENGQGARNSRRCHSIGSYGGANDAKDA